MKHVIKSCVDVGDSDVDSRTKHQIQKCTGSTERYWTHTGSVIWRVPGYKYSKPPSWWLSKKYINTADDNIIFTKVDLHNNKLAFVYCTIFPREGECLEVEVHRKPAWTSASCLILTIQLSINWPEFENLAPQTISEITEAPTPREQTHFQQALRTCGYPAWAFVKTQTSLMWLLAVFEKYQRICANHNILIFFFFFKLGNTLRQRLVHPKDCIPKHQQCDGCSGVQRGAYRSVWQKPWKTPQRHGTAQRSRGQGQDSAVLICWQDEKRVQVQTWLRMCGLQ